MADRGWALLPALVLTGCVMRSNLGELLDEGTTHSEGTTGQASATGGEDGETGNVSLDSASDDAATAGATADTMATAGVEIPPTAEWSVPEGCAAVASESAYCMTASLGSIKLIGVDTGSACAVSDINGDFADNPSFAWRGMSIVTCGDDSVYDRIVRYDLVTGQALTLDVECWTLTGFGEGILVDSSVLGDSFAIYDDLAAIAAGTPNHEFELDVFSTRLWTDGELLLHAWHSTDTVGRGTVEGEPLSDLPLEGYDGWINGMAVVDGALLLLTPGDSHTDYLRKHDPETGALLDAVLLDDLLFPRGLQCRPGEGG